MLTVGSYFFPFLKARKESGFPVIFPPEGFPMKKRFVPILVQTTLRTQKRLLEQTYIVVQLVCRNCWKSISRNNQKIYQQCSQFIHPLKQVVFLRIGDKYSPCLKQQDCNIRQSSRTVNLKQQACNIRQCNYCSNQASNVCKSRDH